MTSPRILVVDDEPDIRELVQEILQDEGYEVEVAEDGAAARAARREHRHDLILLDIWMPDVDGVTLLKEWRDDAALPCPVVMMSGHGTVETAVEATRLGAYDYIEKPLSLAKLLLTVERALEAASRNSPAEESAGESPVWLEPVGRSRVMQELREQAQRLAEHDSWILISGEAGTGKKSLARYMHALGPRRAQPFVEVAAGTLAGEGANAELFGSESGGRVVYGPLEQANRGTLFIDEVADLDLPAQARLLSALQGRSFHRQDGNAEVRVDVRIIAATRLDLEEEVRQGRFREDLYYQLNVVPLRLPPLREHREDVPDLLTFWVNRLADQEKLGYRRFSVAAQNRLRNHDWPGNVRELRNLVQRLLILGEGESIEVAEVEAALQHPEAEEAARDTALESALPLDLPLRDAREQFERIYLQHQLKRAGGNVSQLAKLTGMERTHLYRKLKSLGIDPKETV